MSQLFRINIPKEFILSFLSENCETVKDFYVFNNDTFKKICYNQSINSFYTSCEKYYFLSKQKYLHKMTFNGIATVMRQICNFHEIPYTSKIKYAHSSYTIEYFFKKIV